MHRSVALLLAVFGALTAVSSARAADACPNAQFRAGIAAGLPDCRAWEQVSPVDKAGFDVDEFGSLLAGDDRAVFSISGALSGAGSSPAVATGGSTRSSAWNTTALDPPFFSPQGGATLISVTERVTPDAALALVISNRKLTSGSLERGLNFYVRSADGHLQLAFAVPSERAFTRLAALSARTATVFATNDLRHFAFASDSALTSDAPTQSGDQNLYQWDGGDLRLASVLPDGSPASPVSANVTDRPEYSDDGRRLTVTLASADTSGNNLSGVYQRLDGRSTTLVSRSHRTGDDPSVPVAAATYWPSADGTDVVFADSVFGPSPLTDESPADQGQRLYRWSADGDRLQDLLVGLVPDDQPVLVSDIVRRSADGRYVWFVAGGALRPGAEPFASNLYVLDTAAPRLTFVASNVSNLLDGGAGFNRAGTRVAMDTTTGLSTFDAAAPSDGVTCLTCGVAGAPSPVRIGRANNAISIGGARSHPITDDGRVFFDSPDRLVPQDANAVSDVYEYMPGHGLSLITSGTGSSPATFAEVGPSGRDVFFFTRDALVGQDTDELIDVYDARVDGGIASQLAPQSVVTPCQGDACRDVVAAAPPGRSPGSPAPATAPVPSFALRAPSATARRTAARRGLLRVQIQTTIAGTVKVRATARIRGRARTIATAAERARGGKTTTATLRLSRSARRQLRRKGHLRIAVSATLSTVAGRRSRTIILKQPTRSDRGAAR